MSPVAILSCIAAYFCFLLAIAWFTSRNATNDSYFLGNKASPWYAVAFGMIGDSLSGVTYGKNTYTSSSFSVAMI